MSTESLQAIARRRASAKFGFLLHLAVFTAVNLQLAVLNYGLTSGFTWHRLPMAGWALGLAVHGLAIFFSGSGMRERMIDAEMKRLEASHAPGAQ
jgi:uncharacterized integral membrane protein